VTDFVKLADALRADPQWGPVVRRYARSFRAGGAKMGEVARAAAQEMAGKFRTPSPEVITVAKLAILREAMR